LRSLKRQDVMLWLGFMKRFALVYRLAKKGHSRLRIRKTEFIPS